MTIAGVQHMPFHHMRVDCRQHAQGTRTDNGIASGALTQTEEAFLAGQADAVANVQAQAESDGKTTFRERVILQGLQNIASAFIFRLKHNETVAAPPSDQTQPAPAVATPDHIDIEI